MTERDVAGLKLVITRGRRKLAQARIHRPSMVARMERSLAYYEAKLQEEEGRS